MDDVLNTYFEVAAFVLPVFIALRVALLFWRVKLAEDILSRTSEQRNRLMAIHRSRLLLMKLSLWLIPLMAVLLVVVYWLMPQVVPWAIFIVWAEGMIWAALQYSFEKWLIRYVTEHEPTPPASGN